MVKIKIMPKKDGDKTHARILEIAEKLFSEKGFDATSIDNISKVVGINKATIYYHFKDKKDIIMSLFTNILTELEGYLENDAKADKNIREKISQEITYMKSKRKILSVLMMEAMKDFGSDVSLFSCAVMVIKGELKASGQRLDELDSKAKDYLYVFEFFSGFIPMITYVIFEEKWCEFFECNNESLLNNFIDIFHKTHLEFHNI